MVSERIVLKPAPTKGSGSNPSTCNDAANSESAAGIATADWMECHGEKFAADEIWETWAI